MKKLFKKPKWVDEFVNFAIKGNAVQMAVAVIISTAFSGITKSLTNDIIMPLVGVFIGGIDFKDLKIVLPRLFSEPVLDENGVEILNTLNYGSFIGEIINFLILALVVFFFVKGVTKLTELGKKKEEEEKPVEAPAPEPVPSNEEILLSEIRDLLKKQAENNLK